MNPEIKIKTSTLKNYVAWKNRKLVVDFESLLRAKKKGTKPLPISSPKSSTR